MISAGIVKVEKRYEWAFRFNFVEMFYWSITNYAEYGTSVSKLSIIRAEEMILSLIISCRGMILPSDSEGNISMRRMRKFMELEVLSESDVFRRRKVWKV